MASFSWANRGRNSLRTAAVVNNVTASPKKEGRAVERLQRAVMLLLIILLLTGCGDQRILEKLGFTQTTSYDLDPNQEQASNDEKQEQQKLLVSVTIPRTSDETSRELITATAYTSKEAKLKLQSQTEFRMVSGQLRNTLFGLSLAKQGIWEHI